MIPRLSHYLDRLYTTIHSRQEIEVEEFCILDRSDVPDRTSQLFARLRFWDRSLLQVEEALIAKRLTIIKVRYVYHYQRADGTLIVRYDNAPHHPELPGFPNHKHTSTGVEPAEPPDLSEVLKEIDTYLYPAESK